MSNKADIAIQFLASDSSSSKQNARDKAQVALDEYTRLLDTLFKAGLVAAGHPGNAKGELLVLVSCPWGKLAELVEQER